MKDNFNTNAKTQYLLIGPQVVCAQTLHADGGKSVTIYNFARKTIRTDVQDSRGNMLQGSAQPMAEASLAVIVEARNKLAELGGRPPDLSDIKPAQPKP